MVVRGWLEGQTFLEQLAHVGYALMGVAILFVVMSFPAGVIGEVGSHFLISFLVRKR